MGDWQTIESAPKDQLAIDFAAPASTCRCGAPWVGCCHPEPRAESGRMIFDVSVVPEGRALVTGWQIRTRADSEAKAFEQARRAFALVCDDHDPDRATCSVHRAWQADDPDCPWRDL